MKYVLLSVLILISIILYALLHVYLESGFKMLLFSPLEFILNVILFKLYLNSIIKLLIDKYEMGTFGTRSDVIE